MRTLLLFLVSCSHSPAPDVDASVPDAPADVADAAPFSPLAFGADLALWLVGDIASANAGKVATWPDQSTYKSDFANADPNLRPRVEKAALSGHDVIAFDAVGAGLQSSANTVNLQLGKADAYFIAAVVSTSANGMPNSYLWQKGATSCNSAVCEPLDGLVFGVDDYSYTDDTVYVREALMNGGILASGKPLQDHAFHVVVARRLFEGSEEFRIDGAAETQSLKGSFDISMPNYGVFMGVQAKTLFQGSFAFRVAELVAVHRAQKPIDTGEVTSIEQYLKAKYKTP